MSDALPNPEPDEEQRRRRTPVRILSLFLPRLATDRLIRRRQLGEEADDTPPEGMPLAVVAKIKNALRVVATDLTAERRGLRLGMSLADARGVVPDLHVVEADAEADLALLEKIADWCDRYTPLVALDPPHGLFLDISGCTHLFSKAGADDGETALLADCLSRLHGQGFAARGAVASTAGAAWALAHYGEGGVLSAGEEAAAVADLPVAALRITPEDEALLDRLGLKKIGQLYGKPRAPLAARFGIPLVTRLDQAVGREDEVLTPRRPAPQLSAERCFGEPLEEEAALLQCIASLARALRPALTRNGLGARLIEAAFFRTDGAVIRIHVGTAAPVRGAETIAMLFSERLSAAGSGWDSGDGFDMVRLAVIAAEPFDPAQIDLAGTMENEVGLARLIDRLGARLGHAQVARLFPVDTHIPERAAGRAPVAGSASARPEWVLPDAHVETPLARPVRVFPRPEPVEVVAEVPEGPPLRFRWRRAMHEVARAEGPERIATEWWRPEDSLRATRDYYRVEDAEGRRFWLFREGLYGRETSRPSWYMHGLFA